MRSLPVPLRILNHELFLSGFSDVDRITAHMNNNQKHLQANVKKVFEQCSSKTTTQIQTAAKTKTALGIFVQEVNA